MKRLYCLLFCLTLLLCACGNNTVPEQTSPSTSDASQNDTVDTTAPEDTVPDSLQFPMSAIFMPTVTETLYAEDGTLLYTGTYQEVSLTMPDTDCADAIIFDLLNRIDDNRDSDEQLRLWAQEDYTGQEGWMPYTSEVLFAPQRMDEKVLSLYGTYFSYAGGVHPNYTCISANYDLATGEHLKLEDILVDKVAADKLCQMILDSLAQIAEEYYLYDDYIRTVDERFGTVFDPTWESTDAWYLSSEGLGIYFSPYEIAPYAMGKIEFLYTYDTLDGMINPNYIPADLPQTAPGIVEACLVQDVDLDSFSQFAEVTLDAEGEQVALFTDGLVTNLTLEIGQWDESGTDFYPKATIFAVNTLSPGDAVMLQTMFSDTMPHIRMRYLSGGTEYSCFLFQSGMDGSIILLSDSDNTAEHSASSS